MPTKSLVGIYFYYLLSRANFVVSNVTLVAWNWSWQRVFTIMEIASVLNEACHLWSLRSEVCVWLFQTYPHSPHKFFLLPQLPSSFTTDYLSCLTEKSKAFKWETPQFTATKSPNLFMFCSYSQPAFQLTVEEITFCVPSCIRLSFYFCLILLF